MSVIGRSTIIPKTWQSPSRWKPLNCWRVFQWKSPEQVQAMKSDEQACRRVKEELGDVLIYALNLANEFTFDPAEVVLEKLAINGRKYPVEKAKGRADKYSAYEE